MYSRRQSSEARVGGIGIGGQNPIRIQSMGTVDTNNTEGCVAQAKRIIDAGGELVRFTTQGTREAENMKNISAQLKADGYNTPLVADVHFTAHTADVAAQYCEKVRINPGNYVDPGRTFKHLEYTDEEYAAELQKIEKQLVPFLNICKEHHTAVRIGVNHGSLSDRIMSRYGDTPEGIVESCMEFLRIFKRENFNDVGVEFYSKFGGNENQLDGYEKWLLPQLKLEQRWYGLEQDEGALGRSMERSQQFLLLSALLTLLLAVAAVAVAMNHYCRSRYDLVAILKTLGAGRAQLRKLIVGQWLMVLTLSAVTGGAIGLLFENVLMVLLKPVLPAALPPASLWPWLWALGTMTVISLLVGLRPYRLLLATQPLRVLRNDVVANVWPLKFYLPIVSVVVVLLLAGLMGGSMLLWAVLAGAVVLALLCGVLGWMLLNVLRRMTLKSLPLRLAVSRLLRQPWSTLSQLSAFSLSFMLLALLLVLRGDLLDRWQQQLPPESPNYFLINIATEQVTPLKAFLAEHQIVPESFYPVVRARLTAINDKPTEGNGDEALNRELNLTWQNTRPDHNPIVAGNWPPKADEVSMEEGLAKRLNVALGDTVTFMGDTQEFRAKVTSLRKVDWESLRPNFYFIFPEGALDGQPQSWLTSFRWENGNGMLTQLNRQFPTISLLDIGAILKQVGQVLEQVSRALEVMVVLVTACGMLLLLAQVQVGMRQRHQELVVWRTLGAGKKLLRTTLWCEE